MFPITEFIILLRNFMCFDYLIVGLSNTQFVLSDKKCVANKQNILILGLD